jgi:hypothetical protein
VLDRGWRSTPHTSSFTSPVLIVGEAGWVVRPVWKDFEKRKLLASIGFRTPDRSKSLRSPGPLIVNGGKSQQNFRFEVSASVLIKMSVLRVSRQVYWCAGVCLHIFRVFYSPRQNAHLQCAMEKDPSISDHNHSYVPQQ